MIITLSIRFVPSLSEESRRILNAQASRGVDYNNGNFSDKLKALSSLIIPMFTIAFIKSNDLSNAMDARNYYPNTLSTKYRRYKIRFADILFLFLSFFL
jgi:energy-coupling factor transport system permease protein